VTAPVGDVAGLPAPAADVAGLTAPRFGVWAPVYGNHGARLHPHDAPDASYRRTRDLLLRAEAAGFDSTLLAQHVIHPSNTEDDVLETWSTIAALAEATSRIELIGAVKPLLFNPLVFAKIAANIADIADGRLSVNLVTGWFLPELEGLGLDPLDHDDRYAYSREWLAAVTELWSGKHVAIGDHGGHPALIRPAPAEPPPLYVGGESEPGRALAAEYADVFFINGRPLAETIDVIEDLRARPRHGAPLRFGLSAFVIARETEAEATAELDYLQSLSDAESRPEIAGGTDPKTQMYKVLSGAKRIGSNGGTLAGLVGSYEQVVERINVFHEAGVELFMLQFQPIESELDRFADKIISHFR
jgi:alkanesulfonate monooxygenase